MQNDSDNKAKQAQQFNQAAADIVSKGAADKRAKK